MIIKSHPRKQATFRQLLSYIDRPAMKGPVILQHLTSDRPGMILPDLLDQARLLPKRRNGNILYHEILSFSGRDAPHLTQAVLQDLTRRYIRLRCPDALVYARPHFDTGHPHVHLLITANDLGSTRPRRLSRADFQRVKERLERYQKQRYPELSHSLAQTNTKHPPERRPESELSRRLTKSGKYPRKEEVRLMTQEALSSSDSLASFTAHLAALGFALYRRGNTVGIVDVAHGRRYRLRTLGLASRYEQLSRLPPTPASERDARLADLTDLKVRSRSRDRSR